MKTLPGENLKTIKNPLKTISQSCKKKRKRCFLNPMNVTKLSIPETYTIPNYFIKTITLLKKKIYIKKYILNHYFE